MVSFGRNLPGPQPASIRLANLLSRTPLWPNARIDKATQQLRQGFAITRIRRALARLFWLQFFHVLRQHRMGQACSLMMDSVKWFVQKAERDQTPEPALRHDASG